MDERALDVDVGKSAHRWRPKNQQVLIQVARTSEALSDLVDTIRADNGTITSVAKQQLITTLRALLLKLEAPIMDIRTISDDAKFLHSASGQIAKTDRAEVLSRMSRAAADELFSLLLSLN
jgi:hypothetical protein